MIAISASARQLEKPFGMPTASPGNRWLRVCLTIWLVGVLVGGWAFSRQTLIAGTPAQPPSRSLKAMDLFRSKRCDTLVMVVHPMCPCSHASMSELATLATDCANHLSIDILFAEIDGLDKNTKETALWHAASQIPGATLIPDKSGALSHQLGATTSGQVFLYDADGVLRFSGGITDSRGHAGNNVGRSAIEAVVRNQIPSTAATPVFGCSIW